MLSNLSETLHSQIKLKNKQGAQIWSLCLKKQRFGTTMYFPEGLENTPFNLDFASYKKYVSELKIFRLQCVWLFACIF